MSNEHGQRDVTACDQAIMLILDEHRALARIVEALETLTATAEETQSTPDFELISSMLYYIDAVPEKLHHPTEDGYLFAVLRARDPESATLIDRLEREHVQSPQVIVALERAFVHWQGGARDGLREFANALTAYCDFIWSHMRAEEHEVLPRARTTLLDTDWRSMVQAFSANVDPLFGAERRREFDRLYHRIANLAPRKMRLALLKPDGSAAPPVC
jgi:hemerythrin-like domain-containing protein